MSTLAEITKKYFPTLEYSFQRVLSKPSIAWVPEQIRFSHYKKEDKGLSLTKVEYVSLINSYFSARIPPIITMVVESKTVLIPKDLVAEDFDYLLGIIKRRAPKTLLIDDLLGKSAYHHAYFTTSPILPYCFVEVVYKEEDSILPYYEKVGRINNDSTIAILGYVPRYKVFRFLSGIVESFIGPLESAVDNRPRMFLFASDTYGVSAKREKCDYDVFLLAHTFMLGTGGGRKFVRFHYSGPYLWEVYKSEKPVAIPSHLWAAFFDCLAEALYLYIRSDVKREYQKKPFDTQLGLNALGEYPDSSSFVFDLYGYTVWRPDEFFTFGDATHFEKIRRELLSDRLSKKSLFTFETKVVDFCMQVYFAKELDLED